MSKTKNEKWLSAMAFGERLRCHQMPERSFFINNYQFPVCARCTGVIPASFLAVPLFFIFKPSILLCLILSGIMFIDWFLQHLKILPSTNFRSVVTGIIGGYGFMSLQMHLYTWIFYSLYQFFTK